MRLRSPLIRSPLLALRLSLSLTALVVFTAFAACGDDDGDDSAATPTAQPDRGGDDMSLDAYYDVLQSIFLRADMDTDAANEALNAGFEDAETVEEQVDVLDKYLTEAIAVFDEAVTAMEELSPPPEVEDDHADFMAAAKEAAQLGQDLQADLDDVETQAEAELLLEDFDTEIAAIVERADEACVALQETADIEGIDTDLHCED